MTADVVSGLTPAAKAFFVAAAAASLPRGVVGYAGAGDGEMEEAVVDVGFFLAALEGLSGPAAQRAVLPFPSHEIDPYRGLSPHVGVTSARALALHGIGSRSARVIVASAAALAPRISAPGRLLGAALDLKPGQEIAPTDLSEHLVDAGFNREDPADQHGEFAIRGGIVDIFPAGEAQPVRLEFVGDTVESIRRYDPATQRSVESIDQVTVVPLQDVLTEHVATSLRLDRSATVLDYFNLAGDSRIIVSEPDEVDAQGMKLLEQLEQSYKEVVARKQPAPLPSELFADWDAIEARLIQGTSLVTLGVDDQAASSEGSAGETHIRCQPAVAMHGRVADWVHEIRRVRDEGETVLFVAATPGRAERTIELLKEHEIFAVPADRAEDAQYAAVLVVTGTLSHGFRLPGAGLFIHA